jgi:hypothetical protein
LDFWSEKKPSGNPGRLHEKDFRPIFEEMIFPVWPKMGLVCLIYLKAILHNALISHY